MALIDTYLYRKFVIIDKKGSKIVYYECMKYLYGTLDAALLFWVKLSNDMKR